MSFAGRPYVQGARTTKGPTVIVTGGEPEQNFPLSTRTILILTILILIVIALWTLYSVRKIPITTVDTPVETDILDLDNLIDLTTSGTCCVPPSSSIPNPQWMYDPSINYTFSTTQVTPAVVCQSLSGSAQTACLSYVTGKDGKTLPLAHRGITVYYPFTAGPATTICASYTPC